MEQRLLEAARKGNIDELNDLIGSNGLILGEMFAKKVNADGFSPLNIAAARSDVEIARELLGVGPHLCSMKGWERRIPLHYAIINGELDVMKVLLSASLESIEETTAREEMVLHLAVKNNRFEAVVVLVEHLKQHRRSRSSIGRITKVVNFMLFGSALEFGIVEMNTLNKSGLTPLDVSYHLDRDIREILMQAGAKHGQSNLPSSEIVLAVGDQDNNERATSYQSVMKPAVENDHPQSKDSNQGQKPLDDKRSDLLVVAVLIVREGKRGETVLHLAVKNNRFDIVVVLVEHLKQNEKEQVINWKDHKGNTVLHLAAAVKNFEVVDFMLKYETVEVNASNERGLTPLDLSTLLQRGSGDREITKILARARATHEKGRSNSPASLSFSVDNNDIEGANSHQSNGESITNAPQSLTQSTWKNLNKEKE
ncbi:ankyrin repeat-containing protein BDA1-like [Eucalyptus grandis]|uniref:ankyrin repeat-containing protein BDA1-like n=1 Tax=Eucalyptus grandis TaxID=71139 RepID=UPI00192ED270|nr:ankyrin repeat-containing protein BDA1-like [Eucalyptus grandis]